MGDGRTFKGVLITDLETETKRPWEHPGEEPFREKAQPGKSLPCSSGRTEVSPSATVHGGWGGDGENGKEWERA